MATRKGEDRVGEREINQGKEEGSSGNLRMGRGRLTDGSSSTCHGDKEKRARRSPMAGASLLAAPSSSAGLQLRPTGPAVAGDITL